MGLDKKRGPEGDPTGSGKGCGSAPGSASPETTPIALSALLASEDLLFRDPFADFTPSSR